MKNKELYKALETQYKTKYKGPKSFSEYVAHWFGQVVAKAALSYGQNAYENPQVKALNKKQGIKPEFKDAAEFILDNPLDALLENSYIEDKLRDTIDNLIEKNS